MKMTFSKVTQWMAKNRPLVTLKQSGVLNTVRTKCQHRRLRTEKKTCEVIVCIFRPIIKLYYYFEFTSLHSPPPSIFLEKVFFVNSSIRIIILHTYILRLLNIYMWRRRGVQWHFAYLKYVSKSGSNYSAFWSSPYIDINVCRADIWFSKVFPL